MNLCMQRFLEHLEWDCSKEKSLISKQEILNLNTVKTISLFKAFEFIKDNIVAIDWYWLKQDLNTKNDFINKLIAFKRFIFTSYYIENIKDNKELEYVMKYMEIEHPKLLIESLRRSIAFLKNDSQWEDIIANDDLELVNKLRFLGK